MSPFLRSLPASSSRASSLTPRAVRSLHILPPFANLSLSRPVHAQPSSSFKSADVFLTKAALDRVAREYHQGLLDRLNDQVRGTKYEYLKVLDTVLETARHPDQSLTFNYASSALNNAYFLSGLRQQGNSELDENFVVNLIKSFGSMRAFEEAAAVTIDSMTSSGWLWLVKVDGRIEFRVSYAAGTIVSEYRLQSGQPSGVAFVNVEQTKPQPEVGSTDDEPQRKREWSAEPSSKTIPVRAAHFSGPASTSPFDKQKSTIHPLACLSMHERAYLDTFGHGGKLEYFRRWLHALDFDKLNARLDLPVRHGQASLILRFNASLEQITPEEAEFTNEKLAAAKAYDDALEDPKERLYTTCPPSLLLRWADDTDVTDQGLRREQSFKHFHWSEWAHGRLLAAEEEEVSESTDVAAGEAAAAEGEASTSTTPAAEGEAQEETTAAAASAEPSSSVLSAEEASSSETEAAKDESPKSSP